MSDDEMNRKMEFIVEQQAQFTADIHVLKERQVAFQAEQELLHRDVQTLHEGVATLHGDVATLHGDVAVLRETASTAIEISTRTADAVTTMATAQAETQRQLTLLARLFEAHVRDGHQHDIPTS